MSIGLFIVPCASRHFFQLGKWPHYPIPFTSKPHNLFVQIPLNTLSTAVNKKKRDLLGLTVGPISRVQIRSERDLPNCATANTVCSILQKRYWIPSILNRYCRCPEGVDCPADWTGPDDVTVSNVTSLVRVIKGPAYSLQLNNRAQMKVSRNFQQSKEIKYAILFRPGNWQFCASMKGIETCAVNQSAVNIRINGNTLHIVQSANSSSNLQQDRYRRPRHSFRVPAFFASALAITRGSSLQ